MGKYLVVVTFDDDGIGDEFDAANFVEGIVRGETADPDVDVTAYKLERFADEVVDLEEVSEDYPKNLLRGAKN